MYLLTIVAILAVDFPVFPRQFCKTEIAGYSWMDIGDASFVVIAGWTSALSSSLKESLAPSAPNENIAGMARRIFRKCAPLLLLGFVRLATNKGLEYQEHASEYGVHSIGFIGKMMSSESSEKVRPSMNVGNTA